MTRKRTVILISGRGSNMLALAEAAADSRFPAEIVGVISDQPDAAGLALAAQRGLPTAAIPRSSHASRAEHDAAIDAVLAGWKADLVALAGYMRLLGTPFVTRWLGRLINIHPSLLPSFKGLETHRQALAAGVKLHGCTVHFVTPELDAGPIIAQAAAPVLATDTEKELAARVLKLEHELYPAALALVATGQATLRDGRTVLDLAGAGERSGASLVAPDLRPSAPNLEDLARFTP